MRAPIAMQRAAPDHHRDRALSLKTLHYRIGTKASALFAFIGITSCFAPAS